MSLDTVSVRLLNSPSDCTDITQTTETSLTTPVITPNSIPKDFLHPKNHINEKSDEEECLTNQKSNKNESKPRKNNNKTRLKTKKSKEEEYRDFKKKWNDTIWNLVPCFMAVISIIQVCFLY